MRGVRTICYVTLFLEVCGCRGCAKSQRRVEAADPWPPSSECYSRKQHISHPQCRVFPSARHTQNSLKNSATEKGTEHCSLLHLAQECFTFHVWWQVRRCPIPALIFSVFCKHSLTGQPLTHCLDLYSVSMAAVPQTQLLSSPLMVLLLFDKRAEPNPAISERKTNK